MYDKWYWSSIYISDIKRSLQIAVIMNLRIYKGKLKTSDITEKQTGQKLWRWYKSEVWETLFHIIKNVKNHKKKAVNKQVLKNSSERRWGDSQQPSTPRQRWHRVTVTSLFLCKHHAHAQERRNSELTEIIPEPFLRITATITPPLPWVQKPRENRPGQGYLNEFPWTYFCFI